VILPCNLRAIFLLFFFFPQAPTLINAVLRVLKPLRSTFCSPRPGDQFSNSTLTLQLLSRASRMYFRSRRVEAHEDDSETEGFLCSLISFLPASKCLRSGSLPQNLQLDLRGTLFETKMSKQLMNSEFPIYDLIMNL